jgi:hypothetical protein
VDRITRKELKTDKFAQDVGLTVTFFEEHQKDMVRYGGIAAAVIVLIAGFVIYQKHEHSARQEELAQAIKIQETPVANMSANGLPVYQTQDAKDQAALKAFTDLEIKHSGSDEAQIAAYYIGSIRADEGKMADAEKSFLEAADHGDKNYGSLAKSALADVYFAEGQDKKGEDTLRDLIAHPTLFVSADQASISLARHFMGKNNAEARKLLSDIRNSKSSAAPTAQQLYSQIPPQ